MNNDRLISLILACLLLTGGVAWFSEKLGTPAPAPAKVQTVKTAEPKVEPLPNNAATIRRESDGHFWTRADVQGSSLKFLVDTGASVVALTQRDAKRLRIDLDDLVYNNRVSTAGGEVMSASIRLDYIRIGNVRLEDIDAIIIQEDVLENSLLGMTFLGELYSYEFKGNTMIIRQ